MNAKKICYAVNDVNKETTDFSVFLAIAIAGFKNQKELADYLNISECYLSQILSFDRKPGKIIEKILRLPPKFPIEFVLSVILGLYGANSQSDLIGV